ncbi:hypothetical protein [Oryzifoliimicrobium ureilyticus]
MKQTMRAVLASMARDGLRTQGKRSGTPLPYPFRQISGNPSAGSMRHV